MIKQSAAGSAPQSNRSGGAVLLGPFWTRHQVARYLRMAPEDLPQQDLLQIDGQLSVEEVYPAFQFAGHSVDSSLRQLFRILKRRWEDTAICDWMVRRQPELGDQSPLTWIKWRSALSAALEASKS
jgi:hypothetical protein